MTTNRKLAKGLAALAVGAVVGEGVSEEIGGGVAGFIGGVGVASLVTAPAVDLLEEVGVIDVVEDIFDLF